MNSAHDHHRVGRCPFDARRDLVRAGDLRGDRRKPHEPRAMPGGHGFNTLQAKPLRINVQDTYGLSRAFRIRRYVEQAQRR